MIVIFYAFLGGLLTAGAPCILPLLPILLGTSVGQKSKTRPLFIVLGFILVFAVLGLILSALIEKLGLSPNTLRYIAITALSLFAIFMIWPLPFELLTQKMGGAINQAGQFGQKAGSGNFGGFLLGMTLGVVWTPCAGPILASILVLAASQNNFGQSILLLSAYSLGAGIPMLLIAYLSQWLSSSVKFFVHYSGRLQQIFGVLILLLALAMYFQYDTIISNKLTAFFPQSTLEEKLVGNTDKSYTQEDSFKKYDKDGDNGEEQAKPNNIMEKIAFSNYGQAPEFTGISTWLNSEPLMMKDLKGKVVLVDFWTYSCINCIRTLPYVTKWYDTYKDQGFVVIGVHTPEFAFEKVTSNVETAIKRFGINYPVAQDNDFRTWNAYNNQYWPAEYLIDQNGQIVYEHFGEGNYDHTENAIRQLLGNNKPVGENNGQDLSKISSPEMYFELSRLQYLSGDQKPSTNFYNYQLPLKLAVNNFALEGSWKFDSEKAITGGPAKLRLHFKSGKVFMVAASEKEMTVKITVDGKVQPEVKVQMSQLYPLFDSTDYSEHTIDIEIPEAGFEAFTFTFG